MRRVLIVFLIIYVINTAVGNSRFAAYLPAFEDFIRDFGRVYESRLDEARAFKNFARNKKFIDDWNEENNYGEDGAVVLEINMFADWSIAELERFTGRPRSGNLGVGNAPPSSSNGDFNDIHEVFMKIP
ncbi:CLUMA_CG017236, isoform A [Clunio marinus]|uniref:CLUMA_CG017236, isoform A n=1 Tax=Clunio marinus TaxID=568069 RepID=A0A1J1IX39_9DIPT|nr:CLUMA_CG017236, isoform A [Clunio marinus]